MCQLLDALEAVLPTEGAGVTTQRLLDQGLCEQSRADPVLEQTLDALTTNQERAVVQDEQHQDIQRLSSEKE